MAETGERASTAVLSTLKLHSRGLCPTACFKRYGDVVELKAEKIDDDSALNARALSPESPTDDLCQR
ncbi:hypothetical protein KCP73_19205 [Salmonella enterica subsp. enterica]|nr:hypothetical protein KCP73_19205 [Salmonella enterica subsp. enterica]